MTQKITLSYERPDSEALDNLFSELRCNCSLHIEPGYCDACRSPITKRASKVERSVVRMSFEDHMKAQYGEDFWVRKAAADMEMAAAKARRVARAAAPKPKQQQTFSNGPRRT